MPDNLKETGQQDRDRINVGEPHEIQYWTEELGVTAERLEEAVNAVGPMASDVRAYFSKNSR